MYTIKFIHGIHNQVFLHQNKMGLQTSLFPDDYKHTCIINTWHILKLEFYIAFNSQIFPNSDYINTLIINLLYRDKNGHAIIELYIMLCTLSVRSSPK